jgi:hypothetical protein
MIDPVSNAKGTKANNSNVGKQPAMKPPSIP